MYPNLLTAANGHLSLEFDDAPTTYWQAVVDRLEAQGFTREGADVEGPGQAIYRGFRCAEFALMAGWDNWSGFYLLSNCAAGDAFLRRLLGALPEFGV